MIYDRERLALPASGPLYFETPDQAPRPERSRKAAQVRDLMTPALLAVAPETPLASVAEQMVTGNVHRLFVVDEDGVLVGVISALDLLRHFRGGDGAEPG